MNSTKYFLIATIVMFSQTAHAFDDSRKGFILGLGAGFQTIDTDFNYSGLTTRSSSKSGLATSFKIGAGITDQFSLYYINNVSWSSEPYSDGFTVYDTTIATGMSGLGATYYLSPSAPSAYFMGAIGVGVSAAVLEADASAYGGGAFMIGGGYELIEHVQLEVTYLSADLDNLDNANRSLSTSTLQFTVNYLWY